MCWQVIIPASLSVIGLLLTIVFGILTARQLDKLIFIAFLTIGVVFFVGGALGALIMGLGVVLSILNLPILAIVAIVLVLVALDTLLLCDLVLDQKRKRGMALELFERVDKAAFRKGKSLPEWLTEAMREKIERDERKRGRVWRK